MKKALLVLSLSLTLLLTGCVVSIGDLFIGGCTFSGPPGARYFVTYPDGFTTVGTVRSSGLFNVSKRGFDCGRLVVYVGSNFGLSLAANPSSVYLPNPPASGTITGQSFDATYGMPQVEYFDSNGYLIGSVNATSVSSDGTSLQANMPDLSRVYSGTYQVKVTNKTYDGYYLNIVGSAPMTGWGRDRPDSDGDGWYDDEDCAPYDPYLNYDCAQGCDTGEDRFNTYDIPYDICPPY